MITEYGGVAMPKPVARKRHMKKVLERWENEGGAIPENPAASTASAPSDSPSDKRDKPPAEGDAKTPESKMD
jgi:hypothetical protein